MPAHSPNSLVSSKDLVSTSDNEVLTPSPPPQESSHDEYTPERPSDAKWASQFISPSTRSDTTGSLPSDARSAIHTLYNEIYGEGSQQCLVTQSSLSLIIAHIVQRASKHHQLTLYEYCLGLEFLTFHVDSRKNLMYLKSDWHTAFDAGKWILLPDATTLVDVHHYIDSVIAWRKDPASRRVEDFTSKWKLRSKSQYKLIPLPSMEPEPFWRQADDGRWIGHHHPYHDLPDFECHVAPPYVLINAGPKCLGLDLDQIARTCCQLENSESHKELKHRLELLRDIWALIEGAKEAAKAWEEKEREQRIKLKRKRDEDDIDTASITTKRTTRSQSRSANGSNIHKPTQGSTIRKRKWGNSSNGTTLTEAALSHLAKRKKVANLNMTVQRWVESTYG